jgi:hypothetical protein
VDAYSFKFVLRGYCFVMRVSCRLSKISENPEAGLFREGAKRERNSTISLNPHFDYSCLLKCLNVSILASDIK